MFSVTAEFSNKSYKLSVEEDSLYITLEKLRFMIAVISPLDGVRLVTSIKQHNGVGTHHQPCQGLQD